MSSFRDTFSKDEQTQGQLNYDDAGFIFFGAAVLVTILVPWTVVTLKHIVYPDSIVHSNGMFPLLSGKGSKLSYCKTSVMNAKIESVKAEHRKLSNRFSKSLMLKTIVIAGLWAVVANMAQIVSQSHQEIKRFDPFEILQVTSSATDQEIKKAYRRMSLKYHPDRNPNDPLASANFIQVSKAYNALTDEVAKKNYEKYGNPDGPTTTKVGIGLPRFLLAGENQVLILTTFFLVLLLAVPLIFIRLYRSQKLYASSGVLVETLTFISYYMTDGTRAKNGPEMLACSGEARQMKLRSSDQADMKPLVEAVQEPVKPRFNKQGIVMRNRILIEAHMQRLHGLMSANLLEDVEKLLEKCVLIIQSMVEIALMREWIQTALSLIDFQRMLIQGLDVSDSPLLQIPHFTRDLVRHATSGKGSVASLKEFMEKPADSQRKGCLDMTPDQLKDVEEFVHHVGKTEISAMVEVENETDIAEGDIASVVVDITRANLEDNEAEGPVHAPLFPGSKFEEFWIILTNTANGKMICHSRIRSQEKKVTERLRFMIGSSGDHHLQLHVVSDSYSGMDRLIDLKFKALAKEAVKKELFVHPEDAELDKYPTLYEQMMGIEKEEEYESDDDDDDAGNASIPEEVHSGSEDSD
jgi:translocation protein SEC63